MTEPTPQFAEHDTAQAQADYWAEEVRLGHGQWKARLSLRGLLGLPEQLPDNVHIAMTIPQPHEMRDEKNKVVFCSAILKETR